MMRSGQTKQKRRSAQRGQEIGRPTQVIAAFVALGALLGMLALAWHLAGGDVTSSAPSALVAIGPRAYPPAAARAALPHQRIYSIVRQNDGYTLLATDTTGTTIAIATLPDQFGSEATDVIAALALSPDQHWLAIDGMHDHGDFTWVVATGSKTLRTVPEDANGNFLHWLPDGEHFLFRPFLPTRAADTTWNPGLWIVDAASGTHVNLALPGDLPATDLVDAAPSPDGASIILSVSPGLGLGSSVWLATPDGLSLHPLFHSTADVGLFAWSPDGHHVAFETIADTTVPFRPAGLWLMAPDGSDAHQIALADGGHGYAPAWSPDGTQLAFVVRLNPGASSADTSAGALVSAVQIATPHFAGQQFQSASIRTVATPTQTGQPRNLAPAWQADGTLIFTSMAASQGYGAALAPAALWRATSLAGALELAPLRPGMASFAAATLVP
jgi:Tol biopolymer transport system component